MTKLIPFQFENNALRVSLGDDGAPWFNANDVCEVLGYVNPRKALADHVDIDDVTKRDAIDSIGRTQKTNYVNESGTYSLIFSSHLPDAKRFKRWVTSEVLPAVRRTGSYTAPGTTAALPSQTKDVVDAIFLMGEHLARFPGVKPGIALAATFNCIQANTGINAEPLRKALPANAEPLASLNPTALGKQLGVSAPTVNRLLDSLGFQFKNDRKEWELTKAGQSWAEALPYAGKNHSGYQILWKQGVIDKLKEVRSNG